MQWYLLFIHKLSIFLPRVGIGGPPVTCLRPCAKQNVSLALSKTTTAAFLLTDGARCFIIRLWPYVRIRFLGVDDFRLFFPFFTRFSFITAFPFRSTYLHWRNDGTRRVDVPVVVTGRKRYNSCRFSSLNAIIAGTFYRC